MGRRKPRHAAPSASAPGHPTGAAGAAAAPFGWVVFALALTVLAAAALGVPHEEMLQDTLKSMLVAHGAVLATFLYCWQQRERMAPLQVHGLLLFPLLLMAYALGSMAWSHTFLGGVEAVRWFVFALLLAVGLQTFERDLVPKLAFGIQAGAVMASLWGMAQFWFDLGLFPQGPQPASTFVNRNFAAEFIVTALPCSAFLLARARRLPVALGHALALAFCVIFVLSSGTRSALVAMLVLGLLLPVAGWRFRDQWALRDWSRDQRWAVGGLLVAVLLVLGSVGSGNKEVISEHEANGRGLTPLTRGMTRLSSVAQRDEYTNRSFSIRFKMWKATGRLIAAHPLAGVGAGAWEVEVPLYQGDDTQLETDYYAHNEILQLIAEYGLVGWVALLGLLATLARVSWRTLRDRSEAAEREGPVRCLALLGLVALLLVSNAGFPWRLAGTGALFALYLAVLAASDLRLPPMRWSGARNWAWRPGWSVGGMAACTALLALTAYVSQQAAVAERSLVRAVKLALTISQSDKPDDPRWAPVKVEIVQLLERGVAINRHYRKITPMAGDELAHWGDWRHAVWVYESVAASRPHVLALTLNLARGYAQLGDMARAGYWLARSRQLQPGSPALASVEVVLLDKQGLYAEAAAKARAFFASGVRDPDLVNAAYAMAARAKDWPLAIEAMQERLRLPGDDPRRAAESWLRIGRIEGVERHDDERAMAAFRNAVAAAPDGEQAIVRGLVPQPYQGRL